MELFDNRRGFVHQPDCARLIGLRAGEKRDGSVHRVLLPTEVEDMAKGLGIIQHAVGTAEGLNKAVVFEILVDVKRVEVLAVEAGEQHVDDDGDVDLVLRGPGVGFAQVGIRPLLILDALLHVLVVEVEFLNAVVRIEAGVIAGNDRLQRRLLGVRLLLVVFQLRWAGLPATDVHRRSRRPAERTRRRYLAAQTRGWPAVSRPEPLQIVRDRRWHH